MHHQRNFVLQKLIILIFNNHKKSTKKNECIRFRRFVIPMAITEVKTKKESFDNWSVILPHWKLSESKERQAQIPMLGEANWKDFHLYKTTKKFKTVKNSCWNPNCLPTWMGNGTRAKCTSANFYSELWKHSGVFWILFLLHELAGVWCDIMFVWHLTSGSFAVWVLKQIHSTNKAQILQ